MIKFNFLGCGQTNFTELGFTEPFILKQIHSDIIHRVGADPCVRPNSLEGDAWITSEKNICLAIRTADCVPILLSHPDGIIAAVHAGWRGTAQNILTKCLNLFPPDKSKIQSWIGPSISQANYEVGEDVASQFDSKYLISKNDGKYLLDVAGANMDQLLKSGVKLENISLSKICTYADPKWHSYRREHDNAGRNYALIQM